MANPPTQVAPPSTRQPSSAGGKVTVACCLPNGLQIQPCRMVPSSEPVLGGGRRETQIGERVGLPIHINGTAVPFGAIPRHRIIGGYALTNGVDQEAWETWLKDNKDSPVVKNRLIFAYEDKDRTESASLEMEGTYHGLEPFKIDGDPRTPRQTRREVGVVTKADI